MATTFEPLYGPDGVAIAITLTSLVNSTTLATGYRQSAFVDNSVNRYADVHIYGHVKSSGTPTLNNFYTVFGYFSNDAATPTYCNNASGLDAGYTQPDNDSNMIVLMTSVTIATASLVSYFRGISFCQAAGLQFLPKRWGIIFKNGSGQALTAVAADHVFTYQGVNMQGV